MKLGPRTSAEHLSTPGQDFAPIGDSIDALATDRDLRELNVGGGKKLGVEIDKQAVFRVDGGALHPITPAAKDLFSGELGPRLQRLFGEAARLHDPRPLAEPLRGFAITDTIRGHDLLGAVVEADRQAGGLTTIPKAQRAAWLDATIKEIHDPEPEAQYMHPGWIVYGPRSGAELLSSLRNPQNDQWDEATAPLVLAHELEHAISSQQTLGTTYPELRWIEEGTASILANHPVRYRQFARAFGRDTPWHPAFLEASYADYSKTLLGLLDIAGIPFATDAGLEAARTLLQESDLAGVPARIATQITRHHHLPDSAAAELEAHIRKLDGEPMRLASIKALAEKDSS